MDTIDKSVLIAELPTTRDTCFGTGLILFINCSSLSSPTNHNRRPTTKTASGTHRLVAIRERSASAIVIQLNLIIDLHWRLNCSGWGHVQGWHTTDNRLPISDSYPRAVCPTEWLWVGLPRVSQAFLYRELQLECLRLMGFIWNATFRDDRVHLDCLGNSNPIVGKQRTTSAVVK